MLESITNMHESRIYIESCKSFHNKSRFGTFYASIRASNDHIISNSFPLIAQCRSYYTMSQHVCRLKITI